MCVYRDRFTGFCVDGRSKRTKHVRLQISTFSCKEGVNFIAVLLSVVVPSLQYLTYLVFLF